MGKQKKSREGPLRANARGTRNSYNPDGYCRLVHSPALSCGDTAARGAGSRYGANPPDRGELVPDQLRLCPLTRADTPERPGRARNLVSDSLVSVPSEVRRE
jgi:hypothetical protein